MPFRERLRKTFSRSSSTGDHSSASSLSKTATNGSARKDPNVYQPGEKMPPMKYRRPVAKEHKEHLEAFSFAKAWRRKSAQSMYSPMGSRMPSRAGSVVTSGPSRNGSVTTAGGLPLSRKSFQRGGSLDVPSDGREHETLDERSDEGSGDTNVSPPRDDSQQDTTAGASHSRPSSRANGSLRRPKSPLSNGAAVPPHDSGASDFTLEVDAALKNTHLEVPNA